MFAVFSSFYARVSPFAEGDLPSKRATEKTATGKVSRAISLGHLSRMLKDFRLPATTGLRESQSRLSDLRFLFCANEPINVET